MFLTGDITTTRPQGVKGLESACQASWYSIQMLKKREEFSNITLWY
jgi:hypothetical protein